MASKHRRGSGHSTRDEMEKLVYAVGVPPELHHAYVSFGLALDRLERAEPAPEYGPRVRALVQRWFERGLSGHKLWQIGERVADERRSA